MFKRLMAGIIILVLLLVGVGLALPKSFELSRSVRIQANSLRVLRLVSSLDQWESWWPWQRGNAGTRLRVEEKPANVGAKLSWSGRPAAGHLTLTKATIHAIEYDIQFDANTQPDKGAFELKASPQETELTWRVSGHFETPIIGGYLARMADAMHGGMLEWGLGNIKNLAEADTSDLNLYYQDEQGNEIEEKVK